MRIRKCWIKFVEKYEERKRSSNHFFCCCGFSALNKKVFLNAVNYLPLLSAPIHSTRSHCRESTPYSIYSSPTFNLLVDIVDVYVRKSRKYFVVAPLGRISESTTSLAREYLFLPFRLSSSRCFNRSRNCSRTQYASGMNWFDVSMWACGVVVVVDALTLLPHIKLDVVYSVIRCAGRLFYEWNEKN